MPSEHTNNPTTTTFTPWKRNSSTFSVSSHTINTLQRLYSGIHKTLNILSWCNQFSCILVTNAKGSIHSAKLTSQNSYSTAGSIFAPSTPSQSPQHHPSYPTQTNNIQRSIYSSILPFQTNIACCQCPSRRRVCACVCVYLRACVSACVRAVLCVCVCACVFVCGFVFRCALYKYVYTCICMPLIFMCVYAFHVLLFFLL